MRGWANTQLGLENQEPDFLQFKVTAGNASFDLRTVEPGRTVEVDTPNAAFTIEHAGYYRVDVSGERTSFITRRGGQATVTSAGGEAVAIAPSEEVVIEGTESPQVASYAAPQLDEWDKWNYARTDHLLDAVSARYVSPGVYGVDDLDRYGTWRSVPTYGAVWVPRGVPTGWAPYSTGTLDARSLLRLDLGGHRTLGLGALSLWSLGLCERFLGLGPRAGGGETGLRSRPGRLLRRAQCGGQRRHRRRAPGGLGGARVGRAVRAVVGPDAASDTGRGGADGAARVS